MTTKTSNSVIAAQTALLKRTKAVEEWADQLAKAEAALAHSENAQPSTPDEARALATQRVTDRECVALATSALATARDAEDAARRAVIAAEAEDMAPAIARALKAVAAHQQRTRELLTELGTHTGSEPERWQIAGYGTGNPAETRLKATVKRLQTTQQALTIASEGGDPTSVLPLDELPDSLRIGGVLPCQAAHEQAERDAEAERHRQVTAAEQAELDAAAKVLNLTPEEPTFEVHRLPASRASEFWEKHLGGTTAAQADALLTIARLAGPSRALDNYRQLKAREAA